MAAMNGKSRCRLLYPCGHRCEHLPGEECPLAKVKCPCCITKIQNGQVPEYPFAMPGEIQQIARANIDARRAQAQPVCKTCTEVETLDPSDFFYVEKSEVPEVPKPKTERQLVVNEDHMIVVIEKKKDQKVTFLLPGEENPVLEEPNPTLPDEKENESQSSDDFLELPEWFKKKQAARGRGRRPSKELEEKIQKGILKTSNKGQENVLENLLVPLASWTLGQMDDPFPSNHNPTSKPITTSHKSDNGRQHPEPEPDRVLRTPLDPRKPEKQRSWAARSARVPRVSPPREVEERVYRNPFVSSPGRNPWSYSNGSTVTYHENGEPYGRYRRYQ